MASVVAEVDTWNATMTVPDDGDTRSAASVTAAGVGFQVAADRSLYLRNRLLPAAGHDVTLGLTSPADLVNWAPTDVTLPYTWDATNNNNFVFAVPIPSVLGGKIISLTATIEPSAGSFAAAGTLSRLQLNRVTLATGAISIVDTVTDPAAAAGAYDILHEFTLTLGAAHAFSPTTEALWAHFLTDDAGAPETLTLHGMRMNVQPV